MDEEQPMSINRTRVRGAALACLTGLCLVTLAACGGGGGGGGGSGGGIPTTTMQITPSNAAVRSLSQAQVVDLPEENTFDAVLEDEDQTLVYGFALEAGEAFGTDVVVEGGDERAMVRFYGQYGEEIPTFELEGGGVGIEAPRSGPYFMAISAVPSNGVAQTRSNDAPKGIFKSYKVGKAAVSLFGKTGPQAAKALGRMIAVLFSNKQNKFAEMKKIANEHGFEIIVASRDLFQVLNQMVRPDAVAKDFALRCPSEGTELRPAIVGETCILLVYVENAGAGALDFVDSVVEDVAFERGLFSSPPPVTFYRSIDQDISKEDTRVAEGEFPEWQRALSSTLTDIADIVNDLNAALIAALPFIKGLLDLTPDLIPDADLSFPKAETVTLKAAGTFHYGACVQELPFEMGRGDAIVFPDLTGNNCSEGVELKVEEVPVVSIADAGSVAEGNPLVYIVSLEKPSGREVEVDWRLSDDVDPSDFTGLTIGTLSLSPDTSGTLTFSPGETSKTITLMTLVDQETEGTETAVITLSVPVAVPNAEPPEPPVTPVTLKTQTASGVIGDTAVFVDTHQDFLFDLPEGSLHAIVVSLSKPSSQVIMVNWMLTGSVDTADFDAFGTQSGRLQSNNNKVTRFSPRYSGTLVFEPGVRHISLFLSTKADTRREENEPFAITLFSPTNAVLGSSVRYSGRINNVRCEPFSEIALCSKLLSEISLPHEAVQIPVAFDQ